MEKGCDMLTESEMSHTEDFEAGAGNPRFSKPMTELLSDGTDMEYPVKGKILRILHLMNISNTDKQKGEGRILPSCKLI